MWICPNCHQQFLHTHQQHSCNDKTLDDFLRNKSAHTLELFYHFIDEYRKIGHFVLHPTKSRIGLANHTRFCSITQLGKDFLHIVFHLDAPFLDNYCFTKVSQVPNSNVWNHHCRLHFIEDLNEEVKKYMQLAFEKGMRDSIQLQ
jgi:hypothetical protein